MFSIFKKSLLVVGLLFASFMRVSAFSSSECVSTLKDIAQELMNKNVRNPRVTSFLKSDFDELEEDLIEVCDAMLIYRKDLGNRVNDVEQVKNEVIAYLRSFVAKGIDPTWDINFAVIYNNQNPNFTVTFQNPAGEIRTRSYKLSVKSVGLKFELTVKFEGIFIIGSDFNYYDSIDKAYDLGSGIDFGYYPHFQNLLEKNRAMRETRAAIKAKVRQAAMARCPAMFNVDDAFADKIIESEIDSSFFAQFFINLSGKAKETKYPFGGCLTCCRIKETNSFLCIVGLGIGLGGSLVTGTGIEVSYVFGGSMMPVKE